MKRTALAIGLSQAMLCAGLIAASPLASAQAMPDGSAAGAPADDPKQLDTIVVQGEITYRDRTDDIAPTLSYDLEYFGYPESGVGFRVYGCCSSHFKRRILVLEPRTSMLS